MTRSDPWRSPPGFRGDPLRGLLYGVAFALTLLGLYVGRHSVRGTGRRR